MHTEFDYVPGTFVETDRARSGKPFPIPGGTLDKHPLDWGAVRYSRSSEWREDIVKFAEVGLSIPEGISGSVLGFAGQLTLYANLRPDSSYEDVYDPDAFVHGALLSHLLPSIGYKE
jgi:hypothetical protein